MLYFATAGLPATALFEFLSGGVYVVPVVVVLLEPDQEPCVTILSYSFCGEFVLEHVVGLVVRFGEDVTAPAIIRMSLAPFS